ncbi:carbohydrate ABC transporter membrane protein 1 (CUT1 family) [Hydrogenispora ethanolica]|uniref:Carbohydrate ABC transporter membrane protein 1 (CUT1 family) n=2 Tax=Hydrogenispora ethanolica TaxID=1082276 RepID=A0A4R1QKN1_HYDET|nr:carbohydrate ABC transporter membrane protein 1 (CUT1 family) [Hydrogenispora ethanolica]
MSNLKSLNSRKTVGTRNIMFEIKRDWMLYMLLILPMAFFLVFKYVPMYGVTIAFKDFNLFQGILKSPWVGWDVFKEVFSMPEFYRALRNTAMLNLLDLIVGFPAPIILAILLNEIRMNWFKRTAQTILYLPYFLSWIIIGGIVTQLLAPQSGLVNIFFKSLGMLPVPFLTEKWHWLLTYCLVGVWQSSGWGTIIYLAAITSINHELYDAAEVDGAGRLRRIWHITLPGIKNTIIILLILNLGRILTLTFDRPYIIGNSYVIEFSDVLSTFVYRVGLQSMRYSLATAVGLFQSAVGMIFLLVTNFIANKCGEEGIW